MLQDDPLRDHIIARFEDMPPQLQAAARYILEHPQEVALVSMRELARNAGVQPATMTRLAKFLGLPGYDDIRAHHAEAIRLRADGFAARAIRQDDAAGADGLARQMLQGLAAQIARLCEPAALARIEAVADRLAGARRIYVLGLRSCHSVAWHFHYVMTLLGERTVHLDGPAGTAGDALIRARAGDVLLVVSINPYALHSLELAEIAREKGMVLLAITDSEVSPLVGICEHAILCSTDSQSFFHTLAPALAVSEVLCAALASRDRAAALEGLRAADRQLLALNTYANAIPRRRL
ncbi:MurR/RpiR family transcriptional regulator [Ruixingdingia sedimenti]|uniref:MurR/RpiR family transcriptional regulator n=1 Tax=Ruixingdingia sedimenti TaxID=3073604 RepID=A0ABU1F8R1_9RHOB|nr:MurR/RpiR family transcriptional regulator [Xinfangfangia sp. LG-4]MDR5653269.1 MurR/RpiR family transcriptional regulator [Xinfangfangia sp. LG-4]